MAGKGAELILCSGVELSRWWWLCFGSPQGAVFTFIQAGEAAVQAGDLTVGDCGEGHQERHRVKEMTGVCAPLLAK